MALSIRDILVIVISLVAFAGSAGAEGATGDVDAKIRTLRVALSYGDTEAKLGAIGAVAKLGRNGEGAAELLIKALSDSDAGVRLAAIGALGKIGPSTKGVVAAMTKLVDGKDADVAEAAIKALGQIGPGAAPAIDALLKYAEGKDSRVCMLVIYALGRIGPAADRAVPMLIQAFKKIFIDPGQRINVLAVSGKHSLVCRSSWHSANKSWPLEGKVNISGAEALAMINPKSKPAGGEYALPKELAISLGERLFKATQFTPAQEQELAKWLGSGKCDEKSSSKGSMTAAAKTHAASDGTTQIEISLKGRIEIEQSHRLTDRYGPNWNEAKWSIDILGQLVIDSASGRIIKANITATGLTKGHYGTAGTKKGELYTESFKLTLIPAAPPGAK